MMALRMPEIDYDIVLCDPDPELYRAWRTTFSGLDATIRCGDPLSEKADAYVLPVPKEARADAGLLKLLRERLPGFDQELPMWPPDGGPLVLAHNRALPVVILTPILARTESSDEEDVRAYQAMLSALEAFDDFNGRHDDGIDVAVFSGFKADGLEALDIALQMTQAYLEFCAM
jgi:hypothetical protein